MIRRAIALLLLMTLAVPWVAFAAWDMPARLAIDTGHGHVGNMADDALYGLDDSTAEEQRLDDPAAPSLAGLVPTHRIAFPPAVRSGVPPGYVLNDRPSPYLDGLHRPPRVSSVCG